MLIVSHPWLSIDSRLRDKRQGIVFIGEFELLACGDAQIVVPEVQLVAQVAVEMIKTAQTGQSLIELQLLCM